MHRRLARLKSRSDLLWSIRQYFHSRSYLELDVPNLINIPSVEPHIDPFEVKDEQGQTRFLHTSPEYALKKHLGSGLKNVFYLGACFRNEPCSMLHSPEFTMLEWYTSDASLFDLMDQTEHLITSLWKGLGAPQLKREDTVISMTEPFRRTTVSEVFRETVGFCPIQSNTLAKLTADARRAQLRFSENCNSYDDLFHQLFLNYVEPHLMGPRPSFVWGWPESQAALAKLTNTEPQVALRFELYAGGLELANAFDELTDPVEQRRRFRIEQSQREALGKPIFDLDEELLLALDQIPQTAGIALGVDRLLMLLLNARDLEEVRP